MGGIYHSFNINPYHYSALNPVIYIDPDGRLTTLAAFKRGNTLDDAIQEGAPVRGAAVAAGASAGTVVAGGVGVKSAAAGGVLREGGRWTLKHSDKIEKGLQILGLVGTLAGDPDPRRAPSVPVEADPKTYKEQADRSTRTKPSSVISRVLSVVGALFAADAVIPDKPVENVD